jgi:hypothetical protein
VAWKTTLKWERREKSQLLTGIEHMSSNPCPVTTECMAEYGEVKNLNNFFKNF